MLSRRHLVAVAALAGATGFLGRTARPLAAAEPPPEVTTLRLATSYSICFAPQFVAEALLHAEGFTDIRYAPPSGAAAGG